MIPPALPQWFVPLIIIIAAWEAVWKGIGLWKSARNSQIAWFVCIFLLNTVGILPILYIYFFQKKRKQSGKK